MVEVGVYTPLVAVLLGGFSAWLHKRYLRRCNPDSYVFLAWLVTLLLWCEVLVVNVVGRWFGVLPFFSLGLVPGLFYVGSYPLWFRLGSGLVFKLVGRSRDEGGLIYVLRLRDRTEDFESAWEE